MQYYTVKKFNLSKNQKRNHSETSMIQSTNHSYIKRLMTDLI